MLEEDNPVLTLTDSCDVICDRCPNRQADKCRSECRVGRIDSGCLREYGLSAGDEIRWSDLKKLAADKIISQSKLPQICLDCQWHCFDWN